jgi:UMF1 family MFS transporter
MMNSNRNKLAVFSWGLYDFANTIFSMNIITMYFAQWLIVDNHKEDIWYSVGYSFSMLLVALIMPVLGAISDQHQKRKPYLLFLTLGCVVGTLCVGVVSNLSPHLDIRIYLALLFFVIANFCYEGGLVFYNSLLPEVSTPQNIGRVSGIGVALGYVGAIIGLLLVKPFVQGTLFNMKLPTILAGGREKAFIPTAIFFLIFGLPIFFWVKEKHLLLEKKKTEIKKAIKNVWEGISQTKKYPGVLRFLIADYFFEDAIATVIIFMAVYAQVVMGMGDEVKIWFFIIATTFAVVGSFLCGYVSDWLGPKKTLSLVVLGWIFSLMAMIFTQNQTVFWVIGILVGIFLGSTWTTARPLLTTLSPQEKLGQFFGLYALSGRTAAIIGPLIWGGAVLYLKKDSWVAQKTIALLASWGISLSVHETATIQYRFAILSLVLVMILGWVIFRKVPDLHKAK